MTVRLLPRGGQQACRNLLGLTEIILHRRRHGGAAQRHDALIRLLVFPGWFYREGQIALAQQANPLIAHGRDGRRVIPRISTQAAGMRHIRNQQAHGAVALGLQREAAVIFQHGSQSGARHGRFGQQARHWLRIAMLIQHGIKHRAQPHQATAQPARFKLERRDSVKSVCHYQDCRVAQNYNLVHLAVESQEKMDAMYRLVKWLGVSVAAAALAWCGLWLLTWRLARDQLATLVAQTGGDFRYQLREPQTGSLTSVRLELSDVVWLMPSGLKLTAPRLTLVLKPGRWRHYALQSATPIQLNLARSGSGTWELTAQSLTADLDLLATRRWVRFDATLTGAKLTRQPPGSVLPDTLLQTEQLVLHLEQPATPPLTHAEAGLSLALAAQEATLPPGLLRALPQTVTAVTFNARLLGTPPDWRQRTQVTAWRDSGGTIELDSADFSWGRLSGKLQGTLALDKQLQPEGAGTAQLFLHPPAPGEAQFTDNLIGNLFGLFAKTDTAGTRSITLPLALQERQWALGIFPLGKMPNLVWHEE